MQKIQKFTQSSLNTFYSLNEGPHPLSRQDILTAATGALAIGASFFGPGTLSSALEGTCVLLNLGFPPIEQISSSHLMDTAVIVAEAAAWSATFSFMHAGYFGKTGKYLLLLACARGTYNVATRSIQELRKNWELVESFDRKNLWPLVRNVSVHTFNSIYSSYKTCSLAKSLFFPSSISESVKDDKETDQKTKKEKRTRQQKKSSTPQKETPPAKEVDPEAIQKLIKGLEGLPPDKRNDFLTSYLKEAEKMPFQCLSASEVKQYKDLLYDDKTREYNYEAICKILPDTCNILRPVGDTLSLKTASDVAKKNFRVCSLLYHTDKKTSGAEEDKPLAFSLLTDAQQAIGDKTMFSQLQDYLSGRTRSTPDLNGFPFSANNFQRSSQYDDPFDTSKHFRSQFSSNDDPYLNQFFRFFRSGFSQKRQRSRNRNFFD